MKIALVWHWDQASSIFLNWRDGLKAALNVIEKDHEVSWFLDKTVPLPEDNFDFILVWDDSNSTFLPRLNEYNCRKGLCLTTDPYNVPNLQNVDVVFCESTPVYEAVRAAGLHAIKAFGTDTDFFKPNPKVTKDIEYFYPATYSLWKRQDELAHLGKDLLCIGTMQPDGQEILQKCIKAGVQCEIGFFPAERILECYQRAKRVVIPAIHGSERTVLEAMACNILPKVTSPENRKTRSYLEEYKKGKYRTPRDFVLNNYSHYIYAQNLLKGING